MDVQARTAVVIYWLTIVADEGRLEKGIVLVILVLTRSYCANILPDIAKLLTSIPSRESSSSITMSYTAKSANLPGCIPAVVTHWCETKSKVQAFWVKVEWSIKRSTY